jgi:adenylate cyclase
MRCNECGLRRSLPFTEMTGRLGAKTTYSVVDEFLRLASTTLMSHGALIDKYIGDAVMALFNVPIKFDSPE